MYFQRKFKDLLTVIGYGQDKEDAPVLTADAVAEANALTQTKASVKRMHRKSKMDAAFKGRQKIQMLFARRGIFLNI